MRHADKEEHEHLFGVNVLVLIMIFICLTIYFLNNDIELNKIFHALTFFI